MARGRKNLEITLGENPDATPAGTPDEAGGEGVASIFDFQGDARVRVLHRNEKTQRFEPHGYFPADSTEETILNEFGGGRYRVQLLVRDDTGREIIKTTRDIDLPGAYKPPAGDLPGIGARHPKAPAPNGNGAAAAVAAVANGGNLMDVLNAGVVSTLLDLLKTTKEINSRSAPAPDPMLFKLMEAQAATQQKMMEFMLTLATKDNGGSDRKSIMAELLQMKELFAPANGAVPTDPMKMFNNMLDTFKSFRDAAADVAPETGGDGVDRIMGSIPKLVEVVAEQHQMQKAAREQHAVVRTPAGAASVPEVSTLQPQPELAMWQKILRQQAARLVASAAAKHDPDVIAGTAILFAPPAVKEALMLFFHRDEAEVMADVLAEVPGMAEHREWLGEFILAAQERLFPDEFADDDDDAAEGGEPDGAA